VRAARQSKAALETMARDFESLLTRSGNSYEWLSARVEPELKSGGGGLAGPSSAPMPNAAQVVFFNSATDRYNGEIGGTEDLGGDVSAVGYRLVYRDPIKDVDGGGGSGGVYPVFALYRHLVDPKPAFDSLLAQEDLLTAYSAFQADDFSPDNFVVENIYGLTITFVIEYEEEAEDGKVVVKTERVAVMDSSSGNSTNEFAIAGDGIRIGTEKDENNPLTNGRVVAVDLSITVLSDFGLQQIANRKNLSTEQLEDLLLGASYHYSKSVLVPQP
jgi:hypothetical protein